MGFCVIWRHCYVLKTCILPSQWCKQVVGVAETETPYYKTLASKWFWSCYYIIYILLVKMCSDMYLSNISAITRTLYSVRWREMGHEWVQQLL